MGDAELSVVWEHARIKEKALFPELFSSMHKRRGLTISQSRMIEDARDDGMQASASRNRLLTTSSMSFVLPG